MGCSLNRYWRTGKTKGDSKAARRVTAGRNLIPGLRDEREEGRLSEPQSAGGCWELSRRSIIIQMLTGKGLFSETELPMGSISLVQRIIVGLTCGYC